MNVLILKSYSQNKDFIDDVRQHADNNRNSFGFLPAQAYEEQARKGRLYVAIDQDTNQYLGHVLFGGRFPSLRIFQLNVSSKARRNMIGTKLLDALIYYGEKKSYLFLSARVAADLKANTFWEKSGFDLIRQKEGGKTKKRTINIRRKDLKTPGLFDFSSSTRPTDDKPNLRYREKPLLSSPSYSIDLNVFFDLLKNRIHYDEASKVIQAGMSNDIRICVTAEFNIELLRNSSQTKEDPVLSFAESIPALPQVSKNSLQSIVEEIGNIIFSDKKTCNKRC